MKLTRVIERFPAGQWYRESPGGFRVLDESGTAYTVAGSVKDVSGADVVVSRTVKDESGTDIAVQ